PRILLNLVYLNSYKLGYEDGTFSFARFVKK
ncbi:MAG: hypothetical protein ACI8UX_001224, partial [Psychromonas sp.]